MIDAFQKATEQTGHRATGSEKGTVSARKDHMAGPEKATGHKRSKGRARKGHRTRKGHRGIRSQGQKASQPKFF